MADGLMFAGSFLGTLTAAVALIGLAWRRFRGMAHLVDDLIGEPERPGVPSVPGVMERLAAAERAIRELQDDVRRRAERGCPFADDRR